MGAENFLPEAQLLETAKITVPPAPFISDFGHKFVSFGSCFAQNMKAKLDAFGWETFFLTEICAHYNTETLASVLEAVASEQPPDPQYLYTIDDKVWAYRQHFKYPFLGRAAADAALERVAGQFAVLRSALREADSVILTLGTSHITRLKENGRALVLVAGIPQEHWEFDLLDPEQNIHYLRRFCTALSMIRGGRPVNLVLTVSPQRYLFGVKPGITNHEGTALVDNFLSKCNLRLAAQDLADSPPDGFTVRYFPAFEIVYEELRIFESLAHYDYGHINQQNTPDRVVKQFLLAHASAPVIEQLNAMTRVDALWAAAETLTAGGWSTNEPVVTQKVDAIERELDAFGDEAAAPLLNYRFQLLAQYGRPMKKLLREYPRHRPSNLVNDARLLVANGHADDARTILDRVIAYLGPQRTEDPDAGRSLEHEVFDDAVALHKSLPGSLVGAA